MRIPILVQALKYYKKDRADEDDEVKEKYRRLEFHLVELKVEGEEGEEGEEIELHRDWLPSLLSRTGPANMFASGQSIFIVSGKDSNSEKEYRHLHLNGGAKIKIYNRHQNNKWEWDPVPNSTKSSLLTCVLLLGKFYNFPTWTICPQVFDPNCVVGGEPHWKFLSLPHHLDLDSPLSTPVVSDPSNGRILVHTSSTLYAFYPDEEADTSDADLVRVEGGKWECLDSNFFIWADVVALAADDHLLFLYQFSNHSLLVYDLATKTWLDVDWSTPFLGDLRVADFQFHALFSLPNQFMCFVLHHPAEPNYSIHFLKFRAKRCPDRPRALILTPVSLHSKTLFNTKKVSTILPLCQEAIVDY